MSSSSIEFVRHKKFNYKNNRRLEIDWSQDEVCSVASPIKSAHDGSSESPGSATTCESFSSSQGDGASLKKSDETTHKNDSRTSLACREYQLIIVESSDSCQKDCEPLDLRVRGKKRKYSTSSEAESEEEDVVRKSTSRRVQPRYCKADSSKESPRVVRTTIYAAAELGVDEHFKKSLGIECYNAIFRSTNQRAMSPYSPERSTAWRWNRNYEPQNLNRSYPRSQLSSSSDSVSMDSSTSKNPLPWKRFRGQSYGHEAVVREARVDA